MAFDVFLNPLPFLSHSLSRLTSECDAITANLPLINYISIECDKVLLHCIMEKSMFFHLDVFVAFIFDTDCRHTDNNKITSVTSISVKEEVGVERRSHIL